MTQPLTDLKRTASYSRVSTVALNIDEDEMIENIYDELTTEEIDLDGTFLYAIKFPAMDGANVAIHASSASGGTFAPLYDAAGNALTLPITASVMTKVDVAALKGFRFLKLVSDVEETADRTITLYSRSPRGE